jgi:hypothetical protein
VLAHHAEMVLMVTMVAPVGRASGGTMAAAAFSILRTRR